MSCDTCGGDPVVLSAMNTLDYETDTVCAQCLPGWALAMALHTNPELIDEDGRHKFVIALPAELHESARELYAESVYSPGEVSTPPGGPGPGEPSDGGSTPVTSPATAPLEDDPEGGAE